MEIMNPAKTLPIIRHLMELIKRGLLSLMEVRGEKRGCPSRAKKIMQVLQIAVREVAIRVINRAQALV